MLHHLFTTLAALALAMSAPDLQAPSPPSDANAAGFTHTLTQNAEGRKTGVEIKRRKDQSILSVTTWKEGKREGLSRTYFQNGKVEHDGQYAEDKRSGVWRSWSSCGELIFETPYLEDKVHGVKRHWFNDCDPKTPQTVASETTYEGGEKHGPFNEWHADGTRRYTGQHEHDQKHGEWTYYSSGPENKVHTVTTWDKGQKVSEREVWKER